MNPYEIMLLLDPELDDERQNEILTRARTLVEQRGGSWQGQDGWGRRRLAFEIRHKGEAFYHLLHFDCDPETLDELTRILRITDGVLRYMAVKRIPTSATTSARSPRPAPSREAVQAAE